MSADVTGLEELGVAADLTALWPMLTWPQREGYLRSLRSFVNLASDAQGDVNERARLRMVYLEVMELLDVCSAARQ